MLSKPKALNTVGLVLGIAGVVMIFIWGPPQPSFEQGVALGISEANVLPDGRTVKQYNDDQERIKQRYRILSQVGLGMILAGFAFQLGSVWTS